MLGASRDRSVRRSSKERRADRERGDCRRGNDGASGAGELSVANGQGKHCSQTGPHEPIPEADAADVRVRRSEDDSGRGSGSTDGREPNAKAAEKRGTLPCTEADSAQAMENAQRNPPLAGLGRGGRISSEEGSAPPWMGGDALSMPSGKEEREDVAPERAIKSQAMTDRHGADDGRQARDVHASPDAGCPTDDFGTRREGEFSPEREQIGKTAGAWIGAAHNDHQKGPASDGNVGPRVGRMEGPAEPDGARDRAHAGRGAESGEQMGGREARSEALKALEGWT